DLFRESPAQAIHARRSIRRFAPGPVSRAALAEAVRAACTAPAPHHTRPWLFVMLDPGPVRSRLLAAMAEAWRADLAGDGTAEEGVGRRAWAAGAAVGGGPGALRAVGPAGRGAPRPGGQRPAAAAGRLLPSG